MKDTKQVSKAVIKRLPRYRRYVRELKKKKIDRISSNELSGIMGYTASQIRQDLNNFGGFGQQGYGYNIESLDKELSNILGLKMKYTMVIMGAGNLGQAIANYTSQRENFSLISMFDINPRLIGIKLNEIPVRDYDEVTEFVKENNIDIGVICTGKRNAQQVADRLIEGGIKGIWNFAPIDLSLPEDMLVENVHLSDSLHSLTYHISKKFMDDEE